MSLRIKKAYIKLLKEDILSIYHNNGNRKFRIAVLKARIGEILIERILNTIYFPIYTFLVDYFLGKTLKESDNNMYNLNELEVLVNTFPPGLYRAELRAIYKSKLKGSV